ncbi:MAG: DUF6055 domain-containing protein [Bacteroidales bacterium]
MKNLTLLFTTGLLTLHLFSCGKEQEETVTKPTGKQLYIPSKVWNVPENNDFKNESSGICYKRMMESDNIAVFWAKKFGNDPLTNADLALRFSPENILKEGERYEYYVNDLKFVEKGNSITDKYKCLIFIIDSKDGTAFGGGEGNKVGIFGRLCKNE